MREGNWSGIGAFVFAELKRAEVKDLITKSIGLRKSSQRRILGEDRTLFRGKSLGTQQTCIFLAKLFAFLVLFFHHLFKIHRPLPVCTVYLYFQLFQGLLKSVGLLVMKSLCLCQLFSHSPDLFLDLLILRKFDFKFLDLILLAVKYFLQSLNALLLLCYYVKKGFFLLIIVLPLLIFSALDLPFLQRCSCPFGFELPNNSLCNNLALNLVLPKYFVLLARTLQINRALNTYQLLFLFHRQLTRQLCLVGSPSKPFILDLIWVIFREARSHDYYLNASEYIDWRHKYERRCNHRGIMSLRKAPFETTSVCCWLKSDTISSFACRLLILEAKYFFQVMRTSLLLSISWTVQLSTTTFTRQMARGSSRFPQSKSSMS